MSNLSGFVIALSISDAPDRGKLGFPAREIDRALYSICTVVVRSGGRILYAGDLRPTGYTFKTFRHLAAAYAAQGETPFTHIIAEPVLRRTPFDLLFTTLSEARGTAKTFISLGEYLIPIRRRGEGLLLGEKGAERTELKDAAALGTWLNNLPVSQSADAFTAMRQSVTKVSDARVAIGGKMGLLDKPLDRYEGSMPGVVEEAIISLEADQPFLPLGAFGGAARDLAIALGLIDSAFSVPRGPQMSTYAPAIERVAQLRDRLPIGLLDRLKAVADSDQTESLAYATVGILSDWIQLKAHPS